MLLFAPQPTLRSLGELREMDTVAEQTQPAFQRNKRGCRIEQKHGPPPENQPGANPRQPCLRPARNGATRFTQRTLRYVDGKRCRCPQCGAVFEPEAKGTAGRGTLPAIEGIDDKVPSEPIVAVQRAALRSGNLNIGSRLVCFRSISGLANRGLLELNKNVLSVPDSSTPTRP
jgi:hypothetical protein